MTFTHDRTLRILVLLLAVSLAVVSVAGAFFPSTYERDSASMAAQGAGQDLVDLVVAVPMLLVTFFLAVRGSRKAAFLLAGTLAYIMYSFVIYCFGLYFNRFFLLYCLVLGLSLYAFILVFSDLKKLKVEEWFEEAPVRLISGYMVFVSLVFYILWLKSLVPAILHNEIPREVSEYKLLVNPVHVIDLAFALPGLLIGSVLLWRKAASGYIIAAVSLVFMVLLTLAMAAMVIVLVLREINEDFTVAIVFGVLSILSALMLILLFHRIKSSSKD
jgi:hypothetical protein